MQNFDNTQTKAFDFAQMTRAIDSELVRLGWTKNMGIEHILQKYGTRSRLQLTNEQLIEFWQYLKGLPTP